MRWLAKITYALRSIFLRAQAEGELDEELRSHFDQEVESNMRSGMSPREARFAAQRLIGPVSLYKEECRDARRTGTFDNLIRDVRFAMRTLRKTPLFTAIGIVTLALGIGANTTVFTFVENIILRPLPVAQPQQLVSLNWGDMVNMAYPNYLDFRARNHSFSDLMAFRFNVASIGLKPRESYLAWGYEATGNYFQMLGIHPLLGRYFTPADDDKLGAHPVIVLSYGYWKGHFGGDPNIAGRDIKVNGFPFKVIGVTPPSFRGTEFIVTADFWVPMCMVRQMEPGSDWLDSRYSQNIWTMGRLNHGVSRAQAEADLDAIAHQIERAYPDAVDPKAHFHLSAPGLVGNALRKSITGFGIVLMSVAALVLLLACTNLASMLLARAADRRREVGIRLALGASRTQLLRQFMIESLMLALTGGILGLLVAFFACGLFSAWHPSVDFPIDTAIHPNANVLVFAMAIAFLTILLFGLTPAVQAVRVDVLPSLKDEALGRGMRRWSLRDLIVAGQIALSVILVISSVLVVRSLQHALSLNLGFQPAGAVSLSFALNLHGYNTEQSKRFDAKLLEKARSIPGLTAVGLISNMPLRTGEDNTVFSRADRPVPPRAEWRAAIIYNASPGYFRAAGTRLLQGQDFNVHDKQGAPLVLVVNEALAHLLFPNESAIGKRIRLSADSKDRGAEIIGVVETGKYEHLGEDPHPAIFQPIEQSGTSYTTLVARTALPPPTATAQLRKAVLDLDPELTLVGVGSLQEQLGLPLFPARIVAVVLGIFGTLALVLAATGLFALMAYAVSRRTREIGIRMAIGALPRQVLSSVLRRTTILFLAGLGTGALVTLAAGRLLSAVLYGVSAHDPMTYLLAVILMAAVALAAAWNPARRAVRVDPASVLRES